MRNLPCFKPWLYLLILCLLGTALNLNADAGAVQVLLLHTNDIHGRLLPDKDGATPAGGLSKLSAIIKNLKNKSGGNTITLDAGDFAQGTMESNYFHGEPVIKYFNSCGYDALELGNHDFDWGVNRLRETLKNARFAILGANIQAKNEKYPPFLKPYLIKEIQGVKIAIIGVITPQTPTITKLGSTGGLIFLSPEEAVKPLIAKLKKQGVKTFIVLSHCGIDQDEKLAAQVPEIDLIVGGHSHTWLKTPVKVGKTFILQAYCYTRALGRINLSIDKNSGKILRLTPQDTTLAVASSKVSPDKNIAAMLQTYLAIVQKLKAAPCGKTLIALDREAAWDGEDSSLGNLITDALREATQAQAAIYNLGGIRNDLSAGPISYGEIFSILPFDDNTVLARIRGRELKQILEQSLRDEAAALQVSGLTLEYNPQAAYGSKITRLEIAGSPLNPSREYSLATTEFLLGGGDGYDFSKAVKTAEFPFPRDLIAQYLKNHSPLTTVPGGRINPIN